ncbi:MAG: hypothetical protein J0I84_20485 [Terrimonas sp.]|nr:hypothetical protein [Terrimonas sp.]OJY98273.1 MAG: hypothetical protein BGP13_11580 [Sphingobacteriales bacterium 40-81]
MKFSIFIVILLYSAYSYGQLPVKTLSKNEIPPQIKYTGHIMNAVKWIENNETHYAVTTETGIYSGKGDEFGEFRNAELYAYHYIVIADSVQLIWKVYDYSKDCALDVKAAFTKDAFAITDLDKNGIAEIWLMYETQCTGDVSPAIAKIIMYEGGKRYALRGESRVRYSDKDFSGGTYALDNNFKTGNPLFKQYAQKLWQRVMSKVNAVLFPAGTRLHAII